jgi:uncharacterized protein (TIGR03545 family)
MKVIRWKAIGPLALLLALVLVAWWLLLNPVVRWGVQDVGTRVVGARVDVASADVRLGDGVVALHGLQVTNPGAPMTNLFEAEDVVLNVRVAPLLERKVVVDTLAVRGLRFGTPRATSGAIDDPSPTTGAAFRTVRAWLDRVRLPPLSLAALDQVVNVGAIAAESLATVAAARHAQAYVDTARAALDSAFRQLDVRPTIDSAAALAARLERQNVATLGLAGARAAAEDIRRNVAALTSLDDRLRVFEQQVQGSAGGMQARLEAVAASRQRDYAWARSLLSLPSLDAPSLGPQLLSAPIAERVGDLLYWVQLAERYVPPGLRRRFGQGPDRVRASGRDVLFPREETLPRFLVRLAELSLAIGGEGAAAGDYAARVTGLTTEPAVYGAPTRFLVERGAGRVGPSEVHIAGLLDHVAAPVRDSVAARIVGVTLPTLPLAGLGATVALGQGTTELSFDRRGDQIEGRWLWRATSVTWVRDSLPSSLSPPLALVTNAIWNALHRLATVEIEARFTGSADGPALAIRTNIADAVAGALREQLGAEIRRAETEVRRRVDALVAEHVMAARAAADQVRGRALEQVGAERGRLDEAKAALEARLRALLRIPGIG